MFQVRQIICTCGLVRNLEALPGWSFILISHRGGCVLFFCFFLPLEVREVHFHSRKYKTIYSTSQTFSHLLSHPEDMKTMTYCIPHTVGHIWNYVVSKKGLKTVLHLSCQDPPRKEKCRSLIALRHEASFKM